MATLGTNVPTLVDVAKTWGPDGKPAKVAEILAQTNPILDDMPFIEGNLPTGHQGVVRTGLPAVYWRMINQGIPPSKATSAQVTEQAGMLEAWSEVDVDLAELNGNTNAYRLSVARPFLDAMSIEAAQTVFYGNSGLAPEEPNGLSIRYSSLGAASGQNIIDAGGTGSDNTSIWIVGWGTETVHGIYPKGSQAGIKHENLGRQTVETSAGIAGNRMLAYRDHWQWKMGVFVQDWRWAVRICNIDVSALAADTGGAQGDLVTHLIRATHRLPDGALGKPVIYMNRTVSQYLDIGVLGLVGAGGGVTFDNVMGKRIGNFRGYPVRVTDAILETEARVV